MAETTLMKDGIAEPAIARICAALQQVQPGFQPARFRREALAGLDALELKERVSHLIAVLHAQFPEDFKDTAGILLAIPAVWDRGDREDAIRGFAAWPLIDYVGVHGLKHPAKSLEVLQALTSLFSSELAIRPFLLEHRDLTLKRLHTWCSHQDEHVRRLVSEGTRPRLPWAMRLPPFVEDPSPVIELLEKLRDDPSEYVRRSVANNLNDISKDHPDRVIAIGRSWLEDADENRRRLVRHAARTLVKAGHLEVFPLLGFTENPKVVIRQFAADPAVFRVGEKLAISFTVASCAKADQSMVLDYAMHYRKANGEQKPKVFKLRNLNLAPGESVEIRKTQSFKPITTRRFYPGEHAVEILVNGVSHGRATFTLQA